MKIMSVDFGDARTGIAMCDKTEFLASPITVIHEKRFEHAIEKTADEAIKNKAEAVIVGLPLNMNGSEGPRAELCREFAAKLSEKISVPVRMWDERQTTVSAAGFLNETDTRGKKRTAVIDAVAAMLSTLPPVRRYETEEIPLETLLAKQNTGFEITVEDDVYIVEAPWLIKILCRTDLDDYESLQHFQRVLISSGIIDALREKGIEEGDIVSVYDFEFEFVD